MASEAKALSSPGRILTAEADRMVLAIPQCESGIGSLIAKPDSADLIEGVQVQPYALWPETTKRIST